MPEGDAGQGASKLYYSYAKKNHTVDKRKNQTNRLTHQSAVSSVQLLSNSPRLKNVNAG